MKYTVILIIMLTGARTCFGQGYPPYSGSFWPAETPYFRVPIDSEIQFSTTFTWSCYPEYSQPYITPLFNFDTSIIRVSGSGVGGSSGSENLTILFKSKSTVCYFAPNSAIWSSYIDPSNDSMIRFYYGFYSFQGVIYDPNVIGKILAPDSLDFGGLSVGDSQGLWLAVNNDSFGVYHQIKVLSIQDPFNLHDSVTMLYPCENELPYNCYFHPTHSGHYIDTAKLLDSLTKDTISVVLIGDAYDAGVSSVPEPQVKLFPNPCDWELQIDIPSEATAQIKIYDLFGECVYNSKSQSSAQTVDCSQIPAGVYFVSIDGITSHQTQKLIVAH